MTTRSGQKPKKLCFFCGLPGRMSKEHAWPRWLGRGVEGIAPTTTTRTLGYGRTAADELTEIPSLEVTRQGSVLTSRIREICASCNSGWMSRLEVSAQPLLERLWSSTGPRGATILNQDEAALVATWATKTAWVRERALYENVTASVLMRRSLMDRRSPPELARVWIGRHSGDTNFGVMLGQVEVGHQREAWDTDNVRHVAQCVMTFRGLCVLVRTDSGEGVPPYEMPDSHWWRFWPQPRPVHWPPEQVLTDVHVATTGQTFNWLEQPTVATFRRHPLGTQRIHRS